MAPQTCPKLLLSLHVLLVTISLTVLEQKLVFLLPLKHIQLVTTWGSWIFSSLHPKISARCSHNASFFLFSFQLPCHLVKKAFCVSPLKCCTPHHTEHSPPHCPFYFYLLTTNEMTLFSLLPSSLLSFSLVEMVSFLRRQGAFLPCSELYSSTLGEYLAHSKYKKQNTIEWVMGWITMFCIMDI